MKLMAAIILGDLPADDKLGLRRVLRLQEKRKTAEEERAMRERQKMNFDKRNSAKIPELAAGDEVFVRVGNTTAYAGPFRVTGVQGFDGIPKRIAYRDAQGVEKTSPLKRVLKFSPGRDDIFSRGE